jgi:hypothetical protein
MEDDLNEAHEKPAEEPPKTDWADLRAQAAKLGITLSQLQQQQREQKARLARKFHSRPNPDKTKE